MVHARMVWLSLSGCFRTIVRQVCWALAAMTGEYTCLFMWDDNKKVRHTRTRDATTVIPPGTRSVRCIG